MPSLEARLYQIFESSPSKREVKEVLNTVLSDIRILAETLIAREDFASAEKLIDALLYSWVCNTHPGYEAHLELVTMFNTGIARRNRIAQPQATAS